MSRSRSAGRLQLGMVALLIVGSVLGCDGNNAGGTESERRLAAQAEGDWDSLFYDEELHLNAGGQASVSVPDVEGKDSTVASGRWTTTGDTVVITYEANARRPAERLGLIERWQLLVLAPRPFEHATVAECYGQAVDPRDHEDEDEDYDEPHP